MRLICTSNSACGDTVMVSSLLISLGQPLLVGELDLGKLLLETRVFRMGAQPLEFLDVSRKPGPIRSVISLVNPGLHCISQRRGVIPGLVVDALGRGAGAGRQTPSASSARCGAPTRH